MAMSGGRSGSVIGIPFRVKIAACGTKKHGFQTSDLPFLGGGSVKVNQRSEKHRFGLDVKARRLLHTAVEN